MTDPGAWPELGEELARKSLDILKDRLFAFQEGRISRREMFLVADTLHFVMQGLAPSDATEMVYETRNAIKKGQI